MRIKSSRKVVKDVPIPVYDLSINYDKPCFSLKGGIFSHNTMPAGSEVKSIHSVHHKDHLLIHADYSAAEMAVLAAFSGDDRLMNAFLNREDVHKFTASLVFRKPVSEITKEERTNAKAINFGLVYGVSNQSLADDLFHGDLQKANALVNDYFKAFPGILDYLDKFKKFGNENGYVPYLFGGKIRSNKMKDPNAMERFYNNAPIQGTSSCLAGVAIWWDWKEAMNKGYDYLVSCFTHDAKDGEIHVSQIFDYYPHMYKFLQNYVRDRFKVPFNIDVEFAVNGQGLMHIVLETEPDEQGYRVMNFKGVQTDCEDVIEVFKRNYSVVNYKFTETEEEYEPLHTMLKPRKAYSSRFGTTYHTVSGILRVRQDSLISKTA